MKYFGIMVCGIAILLYIYEIAGLYYGLYKLRKTTLEYHIVASLYIRLAIETAMLIWGTYAYGKF